MKLYHQLVQTLNENNTTLVAVSKTKPAEQIMDLYNEGQRVFGENKVQEMSTKYDILPKDIQWHLIGHLQTNKVKYIAPYVSLIHSVDSVKLAKEINKHAIKNDRTIDILLQIKIAEEESKFGVDTDTTMTLFNEVNTLSNVRIKGLMGMASFSENQEQVKQEFSSLASVFESLKKQYPQVDTLSMGMSGDYELAIQCGSNMVRIGSLLFGNRK